MKKNTKLRLLVIGLIVNAQNDLPKSATDAAPLLIGERFEYHIKTIDNNSVSLESFSAKENCFSFLSRRLVSVL
jgi:hypothetical protein